MSSPGPQARAVFRPKRRYGGANPDIREERRSEFQRDLDRLLYTTYFRRLANVTQVSATVPQHGRHDPYGLVHNRLTHSLKVGQVARRLTQYLLRDADESRNTRNRTGIDVAGGIHPDVAETAGRAHDIGHPPFGHLGEEVLAEIAEQYGLADGFEGNAQTFRVLVTLVRRTPVLALHSPTLDEDEDELGNTLNLTHASLAACVKYPWGRGENPAKPKKFGYVAPDKDAFDKQVVPLLYLDGTGTLEAQIMDWADDITYASHDIEDYAANGRIPLPHLRHVRDPAKGLVAVNPEEVKAFEQYARVSLGRSGKFVTEEAFDEFHKFSELFPPRVRRGNPTDLAVLGALTSHLITITSKATSVKADGSLDVKPRMRGLVEILKQLTWFYVIHSPEIAAVQRGERRRFRHVAKELVEWTLEAFGDEADTVASDVSPKKLSRDEQVVKRVVLPEMLRSLVAEMVDAKNYEGIYDTREQSIVRGTIDYIASLTETEVEDLYDTICR